MTAIWLNPAVRAANMNLRNRCKAVFWKLTQLEALSGSGLGHYNDEATEDA